MNSIFLRIYAGVMLAVVLIGLMAYGAVQLINDYRSHVYRESMARGTFYVMARGMQRQETTEEREVRRQLLSRLMGAEIFLTDGEEFAFSSGEQQKLEQGKVLMRLDDQETHADIFYRLPDEPLYLHTRMEKVSEQQARATAALLLDELIRYPEAQWEDEFDRIQEYFGYPLRRMPADQLSLDRDQRQRLERREIVLSLDEGATRSRSSIYVYAPVGNTGDVLVLGPLALFDWMPLELSVSVGIIGLLAMGLATYFLVRPLQTRLRSLDGAVRRLGSGDFSVRADVGSQDAIGQLASTFNGMTEHIQRLIESQREMTRAVSHELRTPVARLRFGLEMMADCESSQGRHTKLDELDRDIEQLDQLIDEILTFARLEEGTPSVEFSAVDIPELMTQIRQELMPLSGQVSITVDNGWKQLPPESWNADGEARYLHRILQNLVTNALRYATARVIIRYRVEGRLAILEVEDDGPGIAPEERERIFQPFARLDQSRHRASGGYGLGLSIVQRVVEWHGGRAEALDGKLGGALFRITWPRLHANGLHVLSKTG